MKIAVVRFGALLLTSFALAACAGPEPAQVCSHLSDLMKKEGKTVSDTWSKKCEFDYQMDRDTGRAAYKKKSECILAAQSNADATRCM